MVRRMMVKRVEAGLTSVAMLGRIGSRNEGVVRVEMYVHIRQDILVHEFRLYSTIFCPSKGNSTEHAISIEPVGISSQVFVRYRISSIAYMLPAS